MSDDLDLITAADAADYLDISLRSFWRGVASGRIPQPAVRCGRKLVRWRKSDLVTSESPGVIHVKSTSGKTETVCLAELLPEHHRMLLDRLEELYAELDRRTKDQAI